LAGGGRSSSARDQVQAIIKLKTAEAFGLPNPQAAGLVPDAAASLARKCPSRKRHKAEKVWGPTISRAFPAQVDAPT